MCAVSFFFWAVEDQRCGEALELGGHGHRNPPRCHADTRSDLDHDSGIPLQISTEIRTMYPNHVKRWGPHPERCPRLSRQAGQQGILTEPHMFGRPSTAIMRKQELRLLTFSTFSQKGEAIGGCPSAMNPKGHTFASSVRLAWKIPNGDPAMLHCMLHCAVK